MRIPDQHFNRVSVLKKLRSMQPVSRSELARICGLTGSTITAIISDLVERGIVVEEKLPSIGRGRPKVNLSINTGKTYVVGVSISDEAPLLINIVDLNGKSVFSGSCRMEQTDRLGDLAAQIADVIDGFVARSGIAKSDIVLAGIGLPAIVDSRAGIVVAMETFVEKHFAFADAVSQRLGIPARVDNYLNLLARAEHWFDQGAGIDDFTLVYLDFGLGAASYVGGQLMMGSHGIKAELGHTKIVPEQGRPCHCGGAGCLQTYSSVSGVVGQLGFDVMQTVLPFQDMRSQFVVAVGRARAGDNAALAVFDRAGHYLGVGVANHLNMQDPRRVIILYKEQDMIDLIAGSFFAALKANTLPALYEQDTVQFRQLDPVSYSKGAAAMALEQLYQD